MTELLKYRRELALLALQAGDYGAFENNLFHAGMIDLERRYAIIEERGWVTIDGRHVFIGDDKGGSGASSGGSNINGRRKLVRGKYVTSNEEIDRILATELSGIFFRFILFIMAELHLLERL